MIYDHTGSVGNRKVVMAEKGRMETTSDQRTLILTLYKGTSYEEQNKSRNGVDVHPLLRNSFSEYIIRFDLSQFQLSRTNEELFKGGHQMMSLAQLNGAIDSLRQEGGRKEQTSKMHIQPYFLFYRDSAGFAKSMVEKRGTQLSANTDSLDKSLLYSQAMEQARAVQSYLRGLEEERQWRKNQLSRFLVEWHRKLTLSAACFILFLIGAPLGAIIRKGGMGLPLVISILFFLAYHITSITGEKFARESIIPSWQGMWLSSAILFPIGLFLIFKATHDSRLFDSEAYTQLFKKLGAKSSAKTKA
jgi:lipopolysaccharide export system permease protein